MAAYSNEVAHIYANAVETTQGAPSFPFATASEMKAERREDTRFRTAYRLAPVNAPGGRGLARVRNIFDGGMQLETQVPVMLGDRVSVALSDTQTLEARVVWSNGDDCGLRFDERIDSAGALRRAAEEARDTQARQPRLPIDRAAVAVSADGMRPVRVCEVSHRGMKIAHQRASPPACR